MKINKYKNLGQGWHSDSIRHSNARKTGHAGGVYALKSIGNILYKKYKCNRCGKITMQDTNHYGEIYNMRCEGCSWKNPMQPFVTMECIDKIPKGWKKPEKWKTVELSVVNINNKKGIYAKKDIVSELNNKEIVVEKVEPEKFSALPIVKMKEDEGYSVDAVSDIHNNPDKIEIKIKDSGNDEKNSMLLAHEFNEIEKFKKINKNGYKQGSEELAHEQNRIKY